MNIYVLLVVVTILIGLYLTQPWSKAKINGVLVEFSIEARYADRSIWFVFQDQEEYSISYTTSHGKKFEKIFSAQPGKKEMISIPGAFWYVDVSVTRDGHQKTGRLYNINS